MTDCRLELGGAGGRTLAIEWRREDLLRLDPDAARAWRLEGDVDWEAVDRLRVLSARLDDGRVLALAAARPARAGGHGEEIVAAALGDEAGFERLEEVLVSTEYDSGGRPRRLGLELYPPGAELPLRVAADVRRTETRSEGELSSSRALCELRCAGAHGSALLEVLARP